MSDPLDHVTIVEEVGARSPGWYRADCDFCPSSTTGWEPVVEEWGWEHVAERHPRRLARA